MIALILAGGLGTRLGSLVNDLPKPLLLVGGQPFLIYLIQQLKRHQINEVICLIGYHGNKIRDFLEDGKAWGMKIKYSEEKELLGTGGAIKKALPQIERDAFLVVNGDTFFNIDFDILKNLHRNYDQGSLIALKHLEDTSRYGTVKLEEDRIVTFNPKSLTGDPGYINGGIYLLHKSLFNQVSTEKFSIENDLFPTLCRQKRLYGLPMLGEFIDIGIPADYEKSQALLPQWTSQTI